jgi:hypothetical protein
LREPPPAAPLLHAAPVLSAAVVNPLG